MPAVAILLREESMDEPVQKAFDFASDSTKQLITLSTAILALTITFNKDVLQSVSSSSINTLISAWIVYLVSIFFGVLTLLALTGTLDPRKDKNQQESVDTANVEAKKPAEGSNGKTVVKEPTTDQSNTSGPTIQGTNIRILSGLQILTFLVATGLVVKSGASSFVSQTSANDSAVTTEAQIKEIQKSSIEALLRRDLAAIERNSSANGVVVGPLGELTGRGQLLAELSTGELTYDSIDIDNVTVNAYGDTAIVTGYCTAKGKLRTQEFNGQFRFSLVMLKRDAKWQAASLHVTRVNPNPDSQPKPSPSPKRKR